MAATASVADGAACHGEGASALAPLTQQLQEEAAALRHELDRTRLEAQQLRLRLKAVGVSDPSLVPARVRAGSGGSEPQHAELASLLEWLAESVDLTRQVSFECSGNGGLVAVGNYQVVLKRMSSWPVVGAAAASCGSPPAPGTGGDLKVSVPLDMQAEIAQLILTARGPRGLSDATVHRLAESWELVGAEVMYTSGRPEPAIFLAHRRTQQAVVVARWPAVEFEPVSPASFDPQRHFADLAGATKVDPIGGATAWPQVPQPNVSTGDRFEVPQPRVSTGDRVEVEYGGRWLLGVLQRVHGGFANIKCDVDSPGVITVAPLTSVRPAREMRGAAAEAGEQQQGWLVRMEQEGAGKSVARRRARARSVG